MNPPAVLLIKAIFILKSKRSFEQHSLAVLGRNLILLKELLDIDFCLG